MNERIIERLKIKDKQFIVEVLVNFIAEELHKAGFNKAVIGLSGGVDSSFTAFLAQKALGKENVIGISMPYRTTSESSKEDARLVGKILRIEFHEIDITKQIDLYFKLFPDADKVRKGNKMARERMSILYDFAHANNAMVIGTSNKSESLIGYCTRWGDGAHDIDPLGDLYKTQIWDLAEYIGVPEKIVKKKPSADLWPGQTDEGEIGMTYHILDQILFCHVDLRLERDDIIKLGYPENLVDTTIEKIRKSQFKRRMSIICKISQRTVDKDFLYLRDWGL
jgi:NAD+ synthase